MHVFSSGFLFKIHISSILKHIIFFFFWGSGFCYWMCLILEKKGFFALVCWNFSGFLTAFLICLYWKKKVVYGLVELRVRLPTIGLNLQWKPVSRSFMLGKFLLLIYISASLIFLTYLFVVLCLIIRLDVCVFFF